MYGTPSYDECYWSDDFYKDKPDKWGMAVSRGEVTFDAVWNTPETDIWVRLSGDNYDVKLALYYDSLKYKKVDKSSTAGL